ESESVLLARARKLHPDETFPDDPPSRFRKPAPATGAVASGAEAAANGAAVAAVAPKPAAAPAPAPAAEAAPVAAAGLAMMHLPKDIGALPGPIGEKHFPGELEADFDAVLASVDASPVRAAPVPVQIAFRLAEPILGAMPASVKAQLEEAVGSSAAFSRVRSTALNLILNL